MRARILWLDDINEADHPLAGGKACNLARLRRAGFRAPNGFCITTEVWDEFAAENGLLPMVDLALNQAPTIGVAPETGNLKEKILSGDFNDNFLDELNCAIASLESKSKAESKFAVRSSATVEDSKAASFAGQFESFIGADKSEIARCAKRCWASLFSPKALSYGAKMGIALRGVKMAILVHHAIEGAPQGVSLTLWSEAPAQGLMMVEGRWPGDEKNWFRFALSRRDGRIIKHTEPAQELLASSAHDGELASRLKIFSDTGLKEIFRLCMALERHFGAPQDIEWLWEKGGLTILQARPQRIGGSPADLPREVWSRSICDELWPEAMTPMTASIIFGKLSDGYTLKEPLKRVGLGDVASIPALNLIDQRLFLNCHAVLSLIKRIPLLWDIEEIRSIFPRWLAPAFEPERFLWPLLPIFAKLLLLPLKDRFSSFYSNPKKVRREALSLERYIKGLLSCAGRGPSLGELFARLESLLSRVAIFQEANQWSYFYANIFPMVLRKIVKIWCCGDDELFASLLLSPQDNKTSQANSAIAHLWREVQRDDELKAVFGSVEACLVWETLKKEARFSAFVALFDHFLMQYGHRSSRRDLSAQRWSENSGPVIDFINSYLKGEGPPSLTAPKADGHNKAKQSEENALGALSRRSALPLKPLKKAIFKGVLSYTRAYISLREDLRFYLDEALFAFRRLLSECGQKLCESGVLKSMEEIFFLTFDELRQLCHGEGVEGLSQEAAARTASYDRSQRAPCPRFVIDGHPYEEWDIRAPSAKCYLKGIGVSPGVAKGRARVIRNEAEAAGIEPGEVLVAENIDTGLTPFLAVASSALSESGGLLAHSSIVAREFCVPMVAGLKGATKLIITGQELLVDGGRGLVFLE